MRRIALGTFLGLKTTISRVGIVCFGLAIPLAAWLAATALPLSPGQAL